ncbi:MAG: hypothetical protein IRZ14_13720 [Chloroflexi bacterium]|nr:hypothetical protein [Chloroflexota bacterium]
MPRHAHLLLWEATPPRVAVLRTAGASAGCTMAGGLAPALRRAPAERLYAALEAHVALEPLGNDPVGALWRVPAGRPAASERQELARLLAAVVAATGYRAAIGVADGRGPALIAARRARGGTVEQVPAGASAPYLAPLPVALLPVSAALRARLEQLGLHTIGALAARPLGPVQAQFGPEGRLAWLIARGRDTRPVVPREPPCAPWVERELEAPCADRGRLLALVTEEGPARPALLARLLAALPPGRAAGRLEVVLVLENGAQWQQCVVPPRPTAALAVWRRLLAATLGRVVLPAAVVGVRLALNAVGPLPATPLALPPPLARSGSEAAQARRAALAAAAQQVRLRCGRGLLWRVLPLDPHHRLPERRYLLGEYA